MDGRSVFKWATSFIAQATKKCLDEAGVAPEDLDVFIPHQANDRITDTLLRYLKLPESVVVARTIRQFGNNSAANFTNLELPFAQAPLRSCGPRRGRSSQSPRWSPGGDGWSDGVSRRRRWSVRRRA